jgi:hypothetical protein
VNNQRTTLTAFILIKIHGKRVENILCRGGCATMDEKITTTYATKLNPTPDFSGKFDIDITK